MISLPRLSVIFLSVLLASNLTGCKHKSNSSGQEQPTPVTVQTVTLQNIQQQLETTGTITSVVNPVIKSQVNGTVKSIDVADGDTIQQAQIVAHLENKTQTIQYEQALAQLDASKAKLTEATLTQQSKEKLAETGVISKLEYSSALASEKVAQAQVVVDEKNLAIAKQQLDLTLITSSIAGSVDKIFASKGDFVNAGTSIIRVINNNLLQARLPFSQEYANDLAVGQTVHLISPATPGKEYLGQVTAVAPSINPENRSIEVIVNFNSDQVWVPGASIEAIVYLQQTYSVIMVPEEALVLAPNGNFVFVVNNNIATAHYVNVVRHQGDMVAVQSDITSGSQVVVLGAQYLGNGSLVQIQKS
jgi:membrane fusion protein (multidrug efflux system)